jgi:hypothetical protein
MREQYECLPINLKFLTKWGKFLRKIQKLPKLTKEERFKISVLFYLLKKLNNSIFSNKVNSMPKERPPPQILTLNEEITKIFRN